MPGNSVDIQFSGNDQSLLSAYQRQLQAQQKQIENLEKMARGTRQFGESNKKATDESTAGLQGFSAAVAKIGGATGGVLLAARAVREEYERLIQLQEQAAHTQETVGQSRRRLDINFSPDQTVSREQLGPRLQQISDKTRTRLELVQNAFSSASSAKGDVSNEVAAQAVEAAFSLLPNDAGFAVDFSGRLLDLAGSTGVRDPFAQAGFLRSLQQKARIADPSKLGATAVPAINAGILSGDSAEQSAELFGTLNTLLSDVEGNITKTATQNLIARLSGFTATGPGAEAFNAAKGATARLEVLQQNPELAQQFLDKNPFAAESRAAVAQLVLGDQRALAVQAGVRQGVQGPSPQTAADFRAFTQALDTGEFQPQIGAGQAAATNVEQFQLAQTEAGKQAVVRNILKQTLEQMNLSGPDQFSLFGIDFGSRAQLMRAFEVHSQFESPVQAAEGILTGLEEGTLPQSRRAGLLSSRRVGATGEERKLLESQLQVLRNLESNTRPAGGGPPAAGLSRTN